jgi:cell division protein FtsZ
MPQIEDLPLPAQNQLRAQRGELQPENHTEAKRRTLLERLASFGMSRQEEAAAPQLNYERNAPQATPALQPPMPQAQRGQPNAIHAEYAKRPVQPSARPAQAPLDPHGRLAPQPPRTAEEDHLEIPAFLRRQSS